MMPMMHLSSSDEDLEKLNELFEVPKNENFCEETVPQFNDQQLLGHFRISREVASQLSNRYEASQYYHYQKGDSEKTSPFKTVVAFLWYASNEAASLRDVSDRIGITISFLHKIVKRFTYFLSNLSAEFITWPTNEENIEIESHFRQDEFPGINGVIDGTHIEIDKPQDDPDSYLNRKYFFFDPGTSCLRS
ncbi:unnamed protein product [Acanthoscelides obtectus]|uniref:DDE Tnp4 domain-containing protein n=1 Tax=Acanthoscelides obtectus TaxID=200917 RepID=A0A9P0PYA7_ACAOB|nr:unnamed protein product [Acanthoscelides obtectus]CAH2003515.1 unnamed protein product [Acanthoscelides obtectus]CAK1657054.1 Putative nuclease HARBI1 [Acanthoscelides obtectus]CAK1672543.1 Putative nuclease HARBI1 [Acanthoscelides obtectus]